MNAIRYVQIPHGYHIVGTCGKCGGPVLSPTVWTTYNGTSPAQPPRSCHHCGATAKPEMTPNYGPVIEME